MKADRISWCAKGLVVGALLCLAGVQPALAQYNSAGSEKAAAPAVVASVSSASASVAAGGIGSSIGGGGVGGFTAAGAATTNLRRYGSGASGLGAAASDKKFGVWINGAWTHMENDFTNTKFDGDAYIGMVGGDYRVMDNLVVGLAAGFETLDIDTKFNLGTIQTDGFSINPYIAYIINQHFYVDAFAGYGMLNTDVTRTSGTIKGSYDSTRWTGVTNLNGQFSATNQIKLYPQIGILYVHQKDEAYRESGASTTAVGVNYVSLGQARAGAKVGYDLGTVEPYVGARYQYNFVNPEVNLGTVASPTKDRDSVNFQLGLKFKLSSSLTGSLEGNSTQFLKDTTQYGAQGALKFAF